MPGFVECYCQNPEREAVNEHGDVGRKNSRSALKTVSERRKELGRETLNVAKRHTVCCGCRQRWGIKRQSAVDCGQLHRDACNLVGHIIIEIFVHNAHGYKYVQETQTVDKQRCDKRNHYRRKQRTTECKCYISKSLARCRRLCGLDSPKARFRSWMPPGITVESHATLTTDTETWANDITVVEKSPDKMM
jgi:hypothetical protein